MAQVKENLRQSLQVWREGRASLKQVRELATEIGSQHHAPGIPVLVQLLDHKDDIVRYNAAMSLAFEFHHSASGEKLLKMLETDLDEDCRDVAAGAMGTLFENTRNGRIMTSLAKAALNDPDEYVRRSAYRALRVVNGISREQRLEMLGSEDLSVDPVEIKAILQEAFG